LLFFYKKKPECFVGISKKIAIKNGSKKILAPLRAEFFSSSNLFMGVKFVHEVESGHQFLFKPPTRAVLALKSGKMVFCKKM
jgi:hypothetical protein